MARPQVTDGEFGLQVLKFAANILSRVERYTRRKLRVVVRMIGFISSLDTHSLLVTFKTVIDRAISDLHSFGLTVAYALGFLIFISRFLATDLNRETITSKH
jgi:hypothetical protein